MFFSSWNSLLLLFPSWSSTATNSFDPMNSRFSHTAEPGCKQNTVLHQQHQLSISIRFSRLEMLYNLLYNIMNIMRLPFFQDFSDCFHHMVEPLNERLLKLLKLVVEEGWSLVRAVCHLMFGVTALHAGLYKHWFMFMAMKEGCSLGKIAFHAGLYTLS